MRVSFKTAHDHVKQTAEDIGFGMILPGRSPADNVSENMLFYPGLLLVGAGALTNDGATSLTGCIALAVLSSLWADKGKKIRRGLEMSKLFL